MTGMTAMGMSSQSKQTDKKQTAVLSIDELMRIKESCSLGN
jgi:hypothetical protein